MLLLAKILSAFPIFIGAEGQKARIVKSLGDVFYKRERIDNISYKDIGFNFKGLRSNYYKVLAYATDNYFSYFHKTDLGKFMKQNLSADDTFVDIGANLGGYSFLSKQIGANTYCFEPVPELHQILKQNEHAFGNVSNKALSNHSEKTTFFIAKNVEGSSLVESSKGWEESSYKTKIEVECSTFDKEFEDEDNNTIKLVKIDVEGNELAVIQGMKNSLKLGIVENIWCEVRGDSSDRSPGTYRTVSSFLSNYGFKAFKFNSGQLSSFDYETEKNVPQYFDLLYTLTN